MDYTTNFDLAQPENKSTNTRQAYNGNMDIIDAELFRARNLITKNGNVLVKNGDVVYKNTNAQ